MAVQPPICEFGWPMPDFTLPDASGSVYSQNDITGRNGTLIMFICNHCPYVRAVIDRMVHEANVLQELGVGVVAIMSNDWQTYPEDSPENMVKFARKNSFTFPYLVDENQCIAKAYDAVCTPDFFGFDARGGLQYRGRLDDSGKQAASSDSRRDLYEAMKQVAETGQGPSSQISSMGCSIKWRT